MTFGYGARVPVPLETNPNEGGGPIYRSPLVVVRSGDSGMPPYGSPQMVYRTPHAVVSDAEPGGANEPFLWQSKFLPDGRIVPQDALGQVSFTLATPEAAMFSLVRWSIFGTALLGTVVGLVRAKKGKRLGGATSGLLAGVGAGLLIGGIVGRGAALTASLVPQPRGVAA